MTLDLLPSGGDGLHRLDRDPGLARLRKGWYAARDELEALPRHERYLLEVRAVAASRPKAVFARESALALAGAPYGAPEDVFTIGDPNMPGSLAGVRNSHVAVADSDVVVIDGIARCTPAFAVADLARRGRQVDAVSALDAMLRAGMIDREAVAEALSRQGRSGQRRAAWALEFADERAESVGESWSRVMMHRLGAPMPDLQVAVSTTLGDRFPDFRWERPGLRPLAGEFDGAVKYGVIADANGIQPVDAVIAEKRREDAIRATHDMIRWMWDAVLHPERLAAILAAAGLPVRSTLLPGW